MAVEYVTLCRPKEEKMRIIKGYRWLRFKLWLGKDPERIIIIVGLIALTAIVLWGMWYLDHLVF